MSTENMGKDLNDDVQKIYDEVLQAAADTTDYDTAHDLINIASHILLIRSAVYNNIYDM